MKSMLLAWAIAVATMGCLKQNAVENQCAKVFDIREVWADSARGYEHSDTFWRSGSVICGQELQRFSAYPDYWVHVCVNNRFVYWEHWVVDVEGKVKP